MRIQYASDLHLEFPDNSRFLKENPLIVAGDVLVLAGDIGCLGDNSYKSHPFWDWAAEHYTRTIVIPGNHEFYNGFDLDDLYNGWEYKIRSNISCYYNSVIPIGNIELIVTTLWAQIRMEDAFATQAGVTDFKRIRCTGKIMDWVRFNEEHYRCFHFLNDSIKNSRAEHIVVATHHVPGYELMSPQFKGSNLNGAFAIDLGSYIAASPVEYWIYGHSHRNIDLPIGRTHCVSNQLGYVSCSEHRSFDPAKYIEI